MAVIDKRPISDDIYEAYFEFVDTLEAEYPGCYISAFIRYSTTKEKYICKFFIYDDQEHYDNRDDWGGPTEWGSHILG